APHFFRSLSDLPWRGTMLAASGLSLLAALLLWRCVTEGPDRFPAARFDLRMAGAVFHERGPRLACFGYFGHMWELYSMLGGVRPFPRGHPQRARRGTLP